MNSIQVLPSPVFRWRPATVSQQAALDCEADILLLGGAAGSLKTSTVLVDLIQERDYPRMNSYFFRRTYPELEEAMQQAYDLFPHTGGVATDSGRTWRWPASGAHFRFRHLALKKNLAENQGKAMSAIGMDESTHFPMDWIRYLFTRNRSTDPNLKIRMRLGTNPGNVSHKDHMKMFFNGVCPHCEPDKAPPQGELRWNARWHDGIPFEDAETHQRLSVAYILSYVRDHNLLGPGYIARLKMQSPVTAKALLEGCWQLFEGQYFDIWDYRRMTVELPSVPVEWYWPHWTGTDYGYSGSAAASVKFTRSPEGVIYCLSEYPSGDVQGARRENVKDFATNHYNALVKYSKDSAYTQPPNMEVMYLGRDSWAQRGDDHTLAGQMNEVLEPNGLEFVPIGDDRAGGAQLVYTMLANDQLKIARNCRNVIDSLESRIHDEKEPMKVQKDPGSHLCDYFDAFCHGLYGYLQNEGKPASVRIQERMKKIVEKGGQSDMAVTTAVLQYEKIRREESDDEPTVYVGGNARRRMQEAQKGKHR